MVRRAVKNCWQRTNRTGQTNALQFDQFTVPAGRLRWMDTEQTIAEIEYLERIFSVPDTRPLSPSDLFAANRRHDEKLTVRCFGSGSGMDSAADLSLRYSE